MKKVMLNAKWVFIFLFLAFGAAPAQATISGLQPGANVKIVKKDGNAFEGKLIKTVTTEYQISTTNKTAINKYLKDIKKITDTGKSDLGGGISYRQVYEYITINDQSLQGVYFNGLGMMFDVDSSAYGIQKGIAMESLKSIEVIKSGAVGAPEQEFMVRCPHCGKLIKVRISK